MVQAGHMGRVVDRARQRPPQEELVEPAIAAIGVAADEIDVERFEIGGRIGPAREDGADWLRRLILAALMDEDGVALDGTLKTVETL
jgi:hypothetical protein